MAPAALACRNKHTPVIALWPVQHSLTQLCEMCGSVALVWGCKLVEHADRCQLQHLHCMCARTTGVAGSWQLHNILTAGAPILHAGSCSASETKHSSMGAFCSPQSPPAHALCLPAFLYGYHALLDAGKKARNRADLQMGALQHSLPVDACSYPKLLCHCANSDSLLCVLAIQHPAPVPAVTLLVRCVLNNHSPAASQTSFELLSTPPVAVRLPPLLLPLPLAVASSV